MPREAAETQPLLGDQAAVPREAHWTQGCLCQRESDTAPLQGCLQCGERGPRAPRLLCSLPDPQFPGAAGRSPKATLRAGGPGGPRPRCLNRSLPPATAGLTHGEFSPRSSWGATRPPVEQGVWCAPQRGTYGICAPGPPPGKGGL